MRRYGSLININPPGEYVNGDPVPTFFPPLIGYPSFIL